MLLSSTCPSCGRPGPGPCRSCRAALEPIGRLDPAPDGLDACIAAFAYREAGRRLITSLKYANQRAALPWMGRVLAEMLESCVGPAPRGLTVTWVPTTRARRRERGFDQAELLARATARRLGRPARRLLVRHGDTTQTGGDRRQRLAGPAIDVPRPVPAQVLVVDDVLTTGASLRTAAARLRGAGAVDLWGAVMAHTPRNAQVESANGRHSVDVRAC